LCEARKVKREQEQTAQMQSIFHGVQSFVKRVLRRKFWRVADARLG
jgi:hypothetical protein